MESQRGLSIYRNRLLLLSRSISFPHKSYSHNIVNMVSQIPVKSSGSIYIVETGVLSELIGSSEGLILGTPSSEGQFKGTILATLVPPGNLFLNTRLNACSLGLRTLCPYLLYSTY